MVGAEQYLHAEDQRTVSGSKNPRHRPFWCKRDRTPWSRRGEPPLPPASVFQQEPGARPAPARRGSCGSRWRTVNLECRVAEPVGGVSLESTRVQHGVQVLDVAVVTFTFSRRTAPASRKPSVSKSPGRHRSARRASNFTLTPRSNREEGGAPGVDQRTSRLANVRAAEKTPGAPSSPPKRHHPPRLAGEVAASGYPGADDRGGSLNTCWPGSRRRKKMADRAAGSPRAVPRKTPSEAAARTIVESACLTAGAVLARPGTVVRA